MFVLVLLQNYSHKYDIVCHTPQKFLYFCRKERNMDNTLTVLERYVYLISILNNAGDTGLTMDEIGRKWKAQYGSFESRTFHRQREAVSNVFPVEIIMSRESGHPRYVLQPKGGDDGRDRIALALVNSFLMGRELSTNRLPMDRIYWGQAYGNRFTTLFAAAIRDCKTVVFHYHRDRSFYRNHKEWIHVDGPENPVTEEEMTDVDYDIEFKPYALAFETFWFVIGTPAGSETDKRVYALDRITSARITDSTFRQQNFDYTVLRNVAYNMFPLEFQNNDSDDRLLYLDMVKEIGKIVIL